MAIDDQATIEIRAGTPTAREAQAFADLAVAAGGEIFAEVFGPKAEELLKKLYLLEGNYMSYPSATFLWVDDEIVGMLSGYSMEQKNQTSTSKVIVQMLRVGLGQLFRMAWKSFALSGLLSFSGELHDGQFCVSFLAIKPEMRGRRLSQKLLSHAASRARHRGCHTLTLCVETDNQAAVGAYRKWGMEITSTSRPHKRPHHEGEWQMHRMSKAIGPAFG